jgi:quercetin dioxygenase-like cupin family protein
MPMSAKFEIMSPNLFNVFLVTQVAPNTFLEDLLGLDYIVIAAFSKSEIHRHNKSDNVIYIIRGLAKLILDGAEHAVSPGLRVFIPKGMSHGFETTDDALEFISAQVPPILDKRNGMFDREIVA